MTSGPDGYAGLFFGRERTEGKSFAGTEPRKRRSRSRCLCRDASTRGLNGAGTALDRCNAVDAVELHHHVDDPADIGLHLPPSRDRHLRSGPGARSGPAPRPGCRRGWWSASQGGRCSRAQGRRRPPCRAAPSRIRSAAGAARRRQQRVRRPPWPLSQLSAHRHTCPRCWRWSRRTSWAVFDHHQPLVRSTSLTRAFSRVVLPLPVPPEMTIVLRRRHGQLEEGLEVAAASRMASSSASASRALAGSLRGLRRTGPPERGRRRSCPRSGACRTAMPPGRRGWRAGRPP